MGDRKKKRIIAIIVIAVAVILLLVTVAALAGGRADTDNAPEPETTTEKTAPTEETADDVPEEKESKKEDTAAGESSDERSDTMEAENTAGKKGNISKQSSGISSSPQPKEPQSGNVSGNAVTASAPITEASETPTADKRVWVEPVYEKVWVVDKPEEVNYYPIWRTEYHDVCNECGMILDGGIASDHILGSECSSYSGDVPFDVQDGWYEEIIPEEGHWEDVLVEEGHWE